MKHLPLTVAFTALATLVAAPVTTHAPVLEYTHAPRVMSTPLPNEPRIDTPRIEEDDPRWNCATMGNLICGHVF